MTEHEYDQTDERRTEGTAGRRYQHGGRGGSQWERQGGQAEQFGQQSGYGTGGMDQQRTGQTSYGTGGQMNQQPSGQQTGGQTGSQQTGGRTGGEHMGGERMGGGQTGDWTGGEQTSRRMSGGRTSDRMDEQTGSWTRGQTSGRTGGQMGGGQTSQQPGRMGAQTSQETGQTGRGTSQTGRGTSQMGRGTSQQGRGTSQMDRGTGRMGGQSSQKSLIQPVTVSDVAATEVVTIQPDAPASEVVQKMSREDVGSVVVTEGNRPIGIVTDRKIALKLGETSDVSQMRVADLMSEDLFTVPEGTNVFDLVRRLSDKGVRRIPVVDDRGDLKGIVSLDDVVVLLAEEFYNVAEIIRKQSPRF